MKNFSFFPICVCFLLSVECCRGVCYTSCFTLIKVLNIEYRKKILTAVIVAFQIFDIKITWVSRNQILKETGIPFKW